MFPRVLAASGIVLVAAVGTAAVVAVARDPGQPTGVAADLAPPYALAQASARDADQLEAHATAMERIASAQPAHANWSGDAARIRQDASALRFIARSAIAIAGDRGSNPDTAVEVRRVLGDGVNLDQLGSGLTREADALQAHLDAMRAEAAGDRSLIAVIDASAPDTVAMRRDGQAAAERGKSLAQVARGIARTTGQALPGP